VRPVKAGFVVLVALVMALSSGSIALAEKTPPTVPTQQQVDEAAAAATAKRQSVAQIQDDLVAANARVIQAGQDAEVAAEEYNGARWRLEQARAEHAAATAALEQARADVAEQRASIAVLVADSYQRGSDLSTATVLLSKEGPEGVMNRVSVARSAKDSMQVRFEAFKKAQATADAAQRRTAQAEAAQEDLLRQAASARDVAAGAAAQAEAYSTQLTQQKASLSKELAQAQNISVGLAKQRQAGLEREAAARAAALERARQAEAARKSSTTTTGKSGTGKSGEEKSSSNSNSDDSVPEVVSDPPPTGSGASAAISYARSKLGSPYRWGAAGPSSFDCSGLTMMAWRAGGKTLPHYSAAQYSVSTPISRSSLRPGDLVFWGSSPSRIHHVALYIGAGQILHAPRTGKPVQINSIDYWTAPTYFGRP
jgi:cell wall-associated NlpC family hydrolase